MCSRCNMGYWSSMMGRCGMRCWCSVVCRRGVRCWLRLLWCYMVGSSWRLVVGLGLVMLSNSLMMHGGCCSGMRSGLMMSGDGLLVMSDCSCVMCDSFLVMGGGSFVLFGGL